MTGTDLHEDFERLMADEPPHRPLPVLVRAGERRLRSRRLSLGAGALTLAAVGLGLVVSLPAGSEGTTRDETGLADTPSQGSGPSVPSRPGPAQERTLGSETQPGFSYAINSPCGVVPTCDRYEFRSVAASRPVVAAIEFRLTDGSSKRVQTQDGAYEVVITGTIPPGDHWEEKGLVDAAGQGVDLLAGVTLYAADGSVLATRTAAGSDALDPYLEIMQ